MMHAHNLKPTIEFVEQFGVALTAARSTHARYPRIAILVSMLCVGCAQRMCVYLVGQALGTLLVCVVHRLLLGGHYIVSIALRHT